MFHSFQDVLGSVFHKWLFWQGKNYSLIPLPKIALDKYRIHRLYRFLPENILLFSLQSLNTDKQ